MPGLFVLLSCSDPSGPLTPTSITVVGGGGQSSAVASVLTQPIVVEVKDVDGRLVRGASVAWTVVAGSGSVSAPTTTTNGSGRAEVLWTLGASAGENRLNAGVTGVAPTSVTATGEPGAPYSATILFGNNQVGIVSAELGNPITLRVRDVYGNGVPGAPVTFAAAAGTVTPSMVVTDEGGRAGASWTLGPVAGEQTTDATVAGLSTQTRFTATALSLDDVIELQNDEPVSGLSAAQGASRYLRIVVPEGATRLVITTTGGPGDVDVFVREGVLPTLTANDCRSLTPTATEICTILTPRAGQWFVLLDAYSAYSDVTIRATYIIGGSIAVGVTGLPPGRLGSVEVTGPGGYNVVVGTPSTILESLSPGTYTATADFVQYGDTVYVAAPEVQQVQVAQGETVDVSVAYTESTGGLNLDISRAYITQAVQRTDGSVPLVAGRDGLLRVFARGNATNNATPAVRARFYQSGALVQTLTTGAPAASVPISHDEATLSSTWNIAVPGSLIQTGVSVLVDVDPDGEIGETDETDNSFPISGTPLPLDVRTAPTLEARLVPVTQSNGIQADVSDANKDSYVTLAGALYPLPSIDVDVRAPYSFTGLLPSQYDSIWGRLLNEVRLLRIAESSSRYYYGVIKPSYSFGGTGLGYIGLPAAIGVDLPNWRAETVAHEWGHNFGRFHVDCGGPANPDLNYPYVNGRLGHHGWDRRTNTIRNLESHHDLMSYCQPTWSSDYTYEAVLAYRGTAAAPAAGGPEPSLLVWGRISPDGAVLEPSFEVAARPVLPGKTGRYRVTGRNSAGATVLDIAFDGYEVDHLPGLRIFAYAIPLSAMGGSAPAEIRLHGAGVDEVRRRSAAVGTADDVQIERASADRVRLRWDVARSPVLMIRDGRSGEILSFARGGDAQVTTSAAEVEVSVSDGVRSTMRRIAVPR